VGSGTAAPAGVNLAGEGTADWAHWGLISPTTFYLKANVTSQISTYTLVNGGRAGRTTVPSQFRWSDGTPDASNGGTGIGASVSSVGHGFALSVPANQTPRTLHLYVGVHAAQGVLSGSLSDGSAPTYTNSSLDSVSGTLVEEYTLVYQAATAGQTLQVNYTMGMNHGGGNISLEAATLS
jgi:hypothetical protein